MTSVYVVGHKRSPIGAFQGTLVGVSAVELGTQTIRNLIDETKCTNVDIAYIGCVLSAGLGQNPARQVMLACGVDVPSITVNTVCGSGAQALIEAVKSIQSGKYQCAIAGGIESMSNAPYLMTDHRQGRKHGDSTLRDSMLSDGLTDAASGNHMGIITEKMAALHRVDRAAQDDYAKRSYKLSRDVHASQRFANDIAQITVKTKRGDVIVHEDEEPLRNGDINKLDTLRPIFHATGTITAGNASKLSDGACAFVLASAAYCAQHQLAPIAEIADYDVSSGPPSSFPIMPVSSIQKLDIDHRCIDLYEINEAFALVPLLCTKMLGIGIEKVNVNGGAISLGHPLACSGARIVASLISSLRWTGGTLGCASICNGGGGATSIAVRLISVNSPPQPSISAPSRSPFAAVPTPTPAT